MNEGESGNKKEAEGVIIVKCPLHGERRSVYNSQGYWQGSAFEFVDCIEEKCAWYDRENLDCSIRTIARNHHRLKMFFEGDDKWNVQNQ